MADTEKEITPTPRHAANPSVRPHGAAVRGGDLPLRSELFEGRFGRMFRTLPPARFDEKMLTDLAAVGAMTAPFESQAGQTPEDQVDDEENIAPDGSPGIAAGYTYLGQFIDHDLTFDPASSLQKQDDPNALTDFRTPRFDLDNVYGRGPDDQPYLYAADGLHLLLGRPLAGSAFDPNTRDVPRNAPNPGEPARALIGDPRNDENTIVSQLQSTLLRFHNRVADVAQVGPGPAPTFEDVQRLVRWHYQWVVLHDFLPTIVGAAAVRAVLPQFGTPDEGKTRFTPLLHFFQPKNRPYMPIEFSAAAYRFGHSMVRPIYRLNTGVDRFMVFQDPPGDPDTSLAGFRGIPDGHAVDWSLFFPIEPRPSLGPTRVQPAYKPDTSLVNPLGNLPPSIAPGIPSLAERNLLRGLRMGLPSGQAVAAHMGFPVIPDDDLTVGKANKDGLGLTPGVTPNPKLTDISPKFAGNAPLWYYVLAEAQLPFVKTQQFPLRLGPVGGRIVAEVFLGLLFGDPHSYLRQNPAFQPRADFQRAGRFGMAELILQARQWF